MIQAANVTGSGQAGELREMADGMIAEGWITSPHVEAAFRVVPRHLFTPPGTRLETAYDGHRAPVLKTGADGVNLSSVRAVAAGEDDRPGGHRAGHAGDGDRVGRAVTRRCWPRSPGSTSLAWTSTRT